MTDGNSSQFNDRNVLVVGGAGFIGSNLVKRILASSPTVLITIVDNFLSSERDSVPKDGRVSFIEGSITSNRVLMCIPDEFDYVFHLATYHGNQSSIHDPLADLENNVLATLKLMNHLKQFKRIIKLVYSSAGCAVAEKTFGPAKPTPEDAPVSLTQDSPYSISKIIGEFYSVYFHRQHGLPTVRARFQNVYGPGEILGAGKWRGTPATVWRNVIPTFIYMALKSRPLPVENRGVATRDFIYVDDVCRGLAACAFHGKPGDVYNLATGKEISIQKLALIINTLTGNRSGIDFKPQRPWDNSGKRYGDPSKALRELYFNARVELQEGLTTTVEWTKEHLDFIERCISRHTQKMSSFPES